MPEELRGDRRGGEPVGRLDGRVALVTGAARGLGRGFAEAFAAEGALVALADRDAEGARRAAESIGGRALGIGADVTDPQHVERMVATTIRELGGLDILVNNAGIDTVSPLVEMPLALWREMIDVNLTGVFLCTKAAAPHMIERRRGRVINISSQLALKGTVGMSHYCAAKAGVLGLTRAAALELAPYGITVNAIAPGPIDTEMLRSLPPDWLERKRAELPLGRFGRVEEVVPTAVLLASDEGAYYTGSTLNVSGGDVM
jgi:3-oxoacyl-[acyl-carrier protein] reductase